jgi:hypothetical protein
MKRVFDYHSLLPIIKIDKATLSQIQHSARSRDPSDESVGLITGRPDFTDSSPVITFFKFTLISNQDQPLALELNDCEVPAYVLYQSGPIGDLTEFMEDYIESNRILNRYSSNFYYHPFCTASYSDTFNLEMHLVTPNLYITMTEVNDIFESAAPKKRCSYASYSPPIETDSCIRTTYFGITGPDDPRILSLSYSIALSYRGIPIHALIHHSVYKIDVSIANNMYLYKGKVKYENGMAIIKYKYESSYEFKSDQFESVSLLKQIEEMSQQIIALSEQLNEQEIEFESLFQSKTNETQDLLTLITERLQKPHESESRKLPRFGLTKPMISKVQKVFSIESTMEYERSVNESLPGFPIPSLDSPEKPDFLELSTKRVPVVESTKRVLPVITNAFDRGQEQSRQGRSPVRFPPSFNREQERDPILGRTDKGGIPLAPSNQRSVVGKSSDQFPPSWDQTRARQGNRQIPNRETSFLVEDFSMDSKTLFGMLGLSNKG